MKYGRLTFILFVTLFTAAIFFAEDISGMYDDGGFTRLHITYVDAAGNVVGGAHGRENLHGHASPHLSAFHSGNCLESSIFHHMHATVYTKEHDKNVTRKAP